MATRGAVDGGVDAVTARMDARWVSAIVGMKIETPAGALLVLVQDVIVDGYRLLVDRSNLENAPVLSSATPEPGNKGWRRAAESYWHGKMVAAQ